MRIQDIKITALASLLFVITLIGFLMVIGRGILIPIVASIFFSMIIYPVCRFIEKRFFNRILAILVTLILVTCVLAGVIWFFSWQITPFMSELDKIFNLIPKRSKEFLEWMAQTFNLETSTAKDWISNLSTYLLQSLAGSIPNISILLTTLALLPIYSFLFLLYRSAFKQFLLVQVSEHKRSQLNEIIQEILRLAQSYIYGILIVVIILGILNSTGLWLIGLPYPVFWGFLAALLAIIPYIGTFIGGTLPFLYALLYSGTIWQPIAVVLLYIGIQELEGNVITPKVVGSFVKINPLVAIIALFFFGAIWGIAGLILALPMVGIIRLILSHIEPLRPVAMLLGNHIKHNRQTFLKKFNDSRYRFVKFLFRKPNK